MSHASVYLLPVGDIYHDYHKYLVIMVQGAYLQKSYIHPSSEIGTVQFPAGILLAYQLQAQQYLILRAFKKMLKYVNTHVQGNT